MTGNFFNFSNSFPNDVENPTEVKSGQVLRDPPADINYQARFEPVVTAERSLRKTHKLVHDQTMCTPQ